MPETPGRERRNYVRISTDLPVRLMAPCSAAFACDMSTGGIGLVLREQFPRSMEDVARTHEPVKLEIDLPNGTTVTLTAEIMWGHVDKGGEQQAFRMGLRFIDVPLDVQRVLDGYLKAKAMELAFPDIPQDPK
jgi:c-di-GMP-binding flagellar brake protein YcgR